MVQIERLRTMAHEALAEYQSALHAGGEPAYPRWADDILLVCELASVGAEVRQLAPRPRHGARAQHAC